MRFHPLLLLALVSTAAAGQPRPPQERVVSGDGIVTVNVNGAPGRLRIDPAAPALPILTTPYAARARRDMICGDRQSRGKSGLSK